MIPSENKMVVSNIIYSLDTPVSSTNKTDRHVVTEILLKVALNTIKPNQVMADRKWRLTVISKMTNNSIKSMARNKFQCVI
jgi:hypothetical protein